MRTLEWSISHAVFVTEIDDEHKEIFEALAGFHGLLESGAPFSDLQAAAARLTANMVDHFAHEERLMRAARYVGLRWHRKLHQAAHARAEAFAGRLAESDPSAAAELIAFVSKWLEEHTRVADRMMGAALRNHRRCLWKVTFHAGTKPLESRKWVTVDGQPFRPPTPEKAR